MGWTTAMRMLLAVTPSVALSVAVLLVLTETELTAQVRSQRLYHHEGKITKK